MNASRVRHGVALMACWPLVFFAFIILQIINLKNCVIFPIFIGVFAMYCFSLNFFFFFVNRKTLARHFIIFLTLINRGCLLHVSVESRRYKSHGITWNISIVKRRRNLCFNSKFMAGNVPHHYLLFLGHEVDHRNIWIIRHFGENFRGEKE